MFEITENGPNRLDVTISGQIDETEMKAGLDALVEKSAEMQGGVMLYQITDFALPTMGALGVEMRQLPQLFGLIGKFARCAVLSDAEWIKTIAQIEGTLIPGLTIKSFGLDEVAAAEAWLAAS